MAELEKTLGPIMLWGLGVGHVISGMYFGWNLGLEQASPLILGLATILIICLYGPFTLTYAELAIFFPKAGGAFGPDVFLFSSDGTTSDSPLPLVMAKIVGVKHELYYSIIILGVFGLVASFKNALLINMGIGIITLFSNKTAEMITLSCFGALTLYIISSLAHMRLRQKLPDLKRTFKTPFHPLNVSCSCKLLFIGTYNYLYKTFLRIHKKKGGEEYEATSIQ